MTPFVRSSLDWKGAPVKERITNIRAQALEMSGERITWAEAKKHYRRICNDEIWVNDKYQVNVDKSIVNKGGIHWIHLSIKTHGKTAEHDWREFQQIKDELVGPEHEGIELYPAAERVVDTSNQYHIWVLANPDDRIPVGWTEGLKTNNESHGSKQRPREVS
jgi:hypothetical protein